MAKIISLSGNFNYGELSESKFFKKRVSVMPESLWTCMKDSKKSKIMYIYKTGGKQFHVRNVHKVV